MKNFKKLAHKGTQAVFETTITTTAGDKHYEILEITNWQAAAHNGRGTQWCTSATPYRERQSTSLASGYGRAQSLEQSVTDLASHMAEKSSELIGTPWEGWDEEKFINDIYAINGWDNGIPLSKIKAKTYRAPNPYLLSAKSTAENYISDMPLYIIRKDGEPYMQAGYSDYGGIEIMNVEDKALTRASPALIVILDRAIDGGALDHKFVADLQPRLERDLQRWKNEMARKQGVK